MFAKHNPLKSNHANAYRVFAQTSLYPASSLEQSQRLAKRQGLAFRQESMIQTPLIPNANSDWHASLGWQAGRLDTAGREVRKRHWRQILETPKPGRLSG